MKTQNRVKKRGKSETKTGEKRKGKQWETHETTEAQTKIGKT